MNVGSIGAGLGYVPPYRTPGAQETSRPSIDQVVDRLIETKDTDGNGALDGVELSISKEAFARLDRNVDGQLETAELVEGAKRLLRQMGMTHGMTGPTGLARKDDDEGQTPLDLLFGADDSKETGIDALL